MGRDRAARPEAKPRRLFVAVDPPAAADTAMERAVAPWRERLPDARWLRPESRHVTLKFLGRTWPRLVGMVEEACREAAAAGKPFEVSLRGMGVFPDPRRARVVWVGLDDPSGGLASLAEGLEQRLEAEFPRERRGFTPHLTVARFRRPEDLREHAEDLAAAEVAASPFTVDRLVLFESHLHPKGARYEPLAEFPLGG